MARSYGTRRLEYYFIYRHVVQFTIAVKQICFFFLAIFYTYNPFSFLSPPLIYEMRIYTYFVLSADSVMSAYLKETDLIAANIACSF